MKKANQINQVLKEYFEYNISVQKIASKDMMPYFILAGIFKSDTQNGLPIRSFLNRLEKKQHTFLVPFALSEKNEVYVKWYFDRSGLFKKIPKIKKLKKSAKNKKIKAKK